jgi:two-component system OmpR family sensor kinase
MTLSIRVRLTLWYVVVLTIVLLAFAAGLYAFVAAEERAAVDRILRERAESFARAYRAEAGEQSSESAVLEVARDFANGEGDVIVYDANGKLVFRSPPRFLHGTPAVGHGVYTINGVRCIAAAAGKYTFVSTESLAGRRNALRRLRDSFVVLIPIALLIAGFGGYFLASRTLAPVARITEAASRIEAENLSERITVRNRDDELGRLATVLNALLQRLERSFQQQKQLLADTSHELRTPVTIIRSEAEVTLSRERDVNEYRRALEVIRSESAHLSGLIEGVLVLARADAQQSAVAMAPLQLANVIQDAVQALQRAAAARQISLTCTTDGAMPMRGNAELIRRMLLNLLDNAIKFTAEGGCVRLDSHRSGPNYVITVSDTGRGIPFEEQEKIFDRFYRADAARGRDEDRESASGAGLGLPIARWIARAHGGDVRLVRSSASGSIFEVALPISDAGAGS